MAAAEDTGTGVQRGLADGGALLCRYWQVIVRPWAFSLSDVRSYWTVY